MPTRMIDGEALWRSDKLAKVQPPAYRAEYANLIPLALADGTFECNPRRVWADVYSYNRPDMKIGDVEVLLEEFEKVGLLSRKIDEKGKCWGFWIGIESRLPSESTRERYKQGKSHIFNGVDKVTTESRPNHDNIVPRLVLDKIGISMDYEFNNLSRRFKRKFGFKPGKRPQDIQEYNKSCNKFGEEWVLDKFNEWADDNEWVKERRAKFPLADFFSGLEGEKEDDELVRAEVAEKVALCKSEEIYLEESRTTDQKEINATLAEIEKQKEIEKSIPANGI